MEPTELTPFNLSLEPERVRQLAGCLLAPDTYFAVAAPHSAAPNDGEQMLLIQDDRFGEGTLRSNIPFSQPGAMLAGAKLSDPVDVIFVDQDGYVLFMRDGLLRIEKIPGVGNMTEAPEEYGSVGAAKIFDGDLWVATSDRKLLRRQENGQWVMPWPDMVEPLDKPARETFFATGLARTEAGEILVSGYRDYASVVLVCSPDSSWREIPLPRGWLTDVVKTGEGALFLSARRGDIWTGAPDAGFQTALAEASSSDFNAIGTFGEFVFLAGPGGTLFEFADNAVTPISPLSDERPFVISSFEAMPFGLVAQGENGFAVFDGENWTRTTVAWGQ